MKPIFLKCCCLLVALGLVLTLTPMSFAQEESQQVTVLFTHDLHSHLLPSEDGYGGEFGGYARLMTAIRREKEKHPNALLVDGGDFSMGSLFQTAYASSAIELRIMGAMGYDATTFGNHEYDYLPQGLAAMLTTAVDSGEPVPAIVDANYLPPREGETGYGENSRLVWDALEYYGVEEYQIFERGGVYFVLFGLTGYDSDDCAPNSGMILEEPAQAAQRVVEEATKECLERYGVEPVVIALSHSGTNEGEGEDYELAKAVTGIDLIISGHSHTTLNEAIVVGDTTIVSAGEYGKNLGVVHLERKADGTVGLTGYELVAIDETIPEDPEIGNLVEGYKQEVEQTYLSDYGMTFDQVLLQNDLVFDSVDDVYDYAHESTLGNLFSDAYKWAVEQTIGKQVDLALTAAGVIRETIPLGDVTVSDVFNAASLGVGTEGEIVGIYLTGADVKHTLEVDASVYPLMHAAQLYCSGVEYSFNTNRMIFNKVDYTMFRRDGGVLEEIQDDTLYYVVCGMYMGQMLGSVEETSFGLLQITPRDENGNPVAMDELVNYVVRDENGVPMKEWFAIASYLESMGGTMDGQYGSVDGRKVVYASVNPVDLLRNANAFTYALLAGVVVLIVLAVGLIRFLKKKKAKKHHKS